MLNDCGAMIHSESPPHTPSYPLPEELNRPFNKLKPVYILLLLSISIHRGQETAITNAQTYPPFSEKGRFIISLTV